MIFQFVVLILSVIVHEVAHGLMALKLGDETAKREGRLTMNPISHIDPIGTILLPLIMMIANSPVMLGWAKPVPYNPLALYKDFRYGPLKVALAGPFSNLAIALAFGMIIRFAAPFFTAGMLELMVVIVFINSILFVFNLMPLPPLDGSKVLSIFLPREYAYRFESIGFGGIMFIFLLLMMFPGFIGSLAAGLTKLIAGF